MESHPSVCEGCSEHRFPLYRGCLEGHAACVDELLLLGANVDKALPSGVTPLFICCQLGHVEIAQTLCLYGASRRFALSQSGNLAGLRRRRHFRTAEQQVALSEEQGLTSDGDRQELLQWLVASRDWCTPLHHLAAGTALARAQLPYARALDLLRDGASVHERARPDAPSPLDLARANPEGEVASLILLAAEQWSPSTHRKFPYEAQRYAVELLWLGVGLAAQVQEHGYFALIDVWLAVVMPAVIDVGSGVRAVPEAAPTEAQWERV